MEATVHPDTQTDPAIGKTLRGVTPCDRCARRARRVEAFDTIAPGFYSLRCACGERSVMRPAVVAELLALGAR
jgi:hypothetical protein